MPIHVYVSRSGPRLVGSVLYVGGADPASVIATNVGTHQTLWRTVIPDAQAGVDDTPVAVSHGRVLTAAVTVRNNRVLPPLSPHHHADLYALSARTGRVAWHLRLARGTMPGLQATGTPLVVGSTAYVGNAINGTVTAVAVTTGHVLWRFTANGPVKKPPVYANGRLYFVSLHGTLYALSLSGHLIGQQQIDTATNVRRPILINRTLLVVLNSPDHGYLWAVPTGVFP